MKGYKVFNEDWTCNKYQYEVGKTYEHEGEIILCSSGFHFCKKAEDCFNYYEFNSKNKVAEVYAHGQIIEGPDKCATDKIEIVRELPWAEVLEIVNVGEGNTGIRNSGHNNSGNSNSGDYNGGSYNSGDRNSGNFNSGHSNSGNSNSGDYNGGSYNSGDRNNGIFNTIETPVYAFNKPTNMTLSQILSHSGYSELSSANLSLTKWVKYTEEEKSTDPKKALIGGYLKTRTYKEAWAILWKTFSKKTRKDIQTLPNFDPDVFFEITGVKIIKKKGKKV